MVHIDGVETRLVSGEPITITCCLQSSKYTRLQKSAVKWIKKNYNSDYNFRSAFVLIQDKSLAMEVINDARVKSESGEAILMIEYDVICE